MTCQPIPTDQPGIFRCPACGKQNPRPIKKPFHAGCGKSPPPPDLRPLAVELALLTGNQAILDNLTLYAQSLHAWSDIGCEVRDTEEQAFILALCRRCERYDAETDLCSCGGCKRRVGIPLAVRVVMASESCPGLRW